MPTKNDPIDHAPQVPGDFGVDDTPYTEDDSQGQFSPPLPEPDGRE